MDNKITLEDIREALINIEESTMLNSYSTLYFTIYCKDGKPDKIELSLEQFNDLRIISDCRLVPNKIETIFGMGVVING